MTRDDGADLEGEALRFRRSHLMRAGCSNLAGLDHMLERFPHGPDEALIKLRLTDIGGGRELLDALQEEYQGVLDEILDNCRLMERTWDVDFERDVALDGNRRVDARISWPDGTPKIRLSLGLCLALDDALLTVLSVLGFFTARPGQDELSEGYAIADCGVEGVGRYVDYRFDEALSAERIASTLTGIMPLDPMRFLQADLLLALAVEWIVLHEQAHSLLGHIGWRREAGAADLDEALFVDGGDEGEGAQNYCLELQADALATQMLFAEGLSDDALSRRSLARYGEGVALHSGRRRAFPPDIATRADRFHALLLASSVSSMLFELRRERGGRRGVSHPPPATRVLNIFMSAMAVWGDVTEFEAGTEPSRDDEYSLDHVRLAAHIVQRAFLELEMAARVLQVDNPLYRSEMLMRESSDRLGRKDLSPLAEDFYRLMAGVREPTALTTDAARTYVELLDHSRRIYRELAPFAVVLGDT